MGRIANLDEGFWCVSRSENNRGYQVSLSPLDRSIDMQRRHMSQCYYHTSKSWSKKVGTQDVCPRDLQDDSGLCREGDSITPVVVDLTAALTSS